MFFRDDLLVLSWWRRRRLPESGSSPTVRAGTTTKHDECKHGEHWFHRVIPILNPIIPKCHSGQGELREGRLKAPLGSAAADRPRPAVDDLRRHGGSLRLAGDDLPGPGDDLRREVCDLRREVYDLRREVCDLRRGVLRKPGRVYCLRLKRRGWNDEFHRGPSGMRPGNEARRRGKVPRLRASACAANASFPFPRSALRIPRGAAASRVRRFQSWLSFLKRRSARSSSARLTPRCGPSRPVTIEA